MGVGCPGEADSLGVISLDQVSWRLPKDREFKWMKGQALRPHSFLEPLGTVLAQDADVRVTSVYRALTGWQTEFQALETPENKIKPFLGGGHQSGLAVGGS